MEWYWYLIIGWLGLSLILLIIEIKKAPLVDDKRPFLHDDYDPEKDPTAKYVSVFCNNCLKNLDGIYCNNGVHLRKIGDEMIEECEKEKYFEPK